MFHLPFSCFYDMIMLCFVYIIKGGYGSMKFGEKLIRLRRKNGMSQEQLAAEIGITRQSVSKWESGSTLPELAKLIVISELFDVSVDYLVKDSMEEDFS